MLVVNDAAGSELELVLDLEELPGFILVLGTLLHGDGVMVGVDGTGFGFDINGFLLFADDGSGLGVQGVKYFDISNTGI